MPHTVPGHGGEEGWPVPDPRSPYLDFAPTPSFDIVHGLDNEGGDDDAYDDEMTCIMAMMVFQKNTTRPIHNRCRKGESKSSIKMLQFHDDKRKYKRGSPLCSSSEQGGCKRVLEAFF